MKIIDCIGESLFCLPAVFFIVGIALLHNHEKKIAVVHESGHALMAHKHQILDAVHVRSLLGTFNVLNPWYYPGRTYADLPSAFNTEGLGPDISTLQNAIDVALSGMVATDLILGNDYQNKAKEDLKYAKGLANLIAVIKTEDHIAPGMIRDILAGRIKLSNQAQTIACKEIEDGKKRSYDYLRPRQNIIINIAELLSRRAGNKVSKHEIDYIISNSLNDIKGSVPNYDQ